MPIASFFRSAARPLRALFVASLTVAAALAQSPSAADGFDPNVDGNVYALAAQADGRVILGGQFSTLRPSIGVAAARTNLARVNIDGSLDLSFDPGADGPIRAVVLQSDGKLLVGGKFDRIAGAARTNLARLNADGSLDATFNAGAINAVVNAIVVLPDGRLVIGGAFTSVAGTARGRCARLSATGALDATFNPNFNNIVFALATHAEGKVIVGGAFTSLQPPQESAPTGRGRLARLNPNGTPDSQFDGGANNSVYAIAVQRDGRIIIGGAFSTVQPILTPSAQSRSRLARLQPTGDFDSSFIAGASGDVNALIVQPDGSVLAGGVFSSAFGGGIAPAGRSFLARFSADGALDTNFTPGVNQAVSALALLPDGKFVAGGYFTRAASRGLPVGVIRNRLARFSADGSLDATLALEDAGRPHFSIVQSDGRILIAGTFTSVGGTTRNYFARLNADGTLDPAFNPNPNGQIKSIALQSDGRILVGGTFTSIGGVSRNRLARLSAAGVVDTAFDPNPDSAVEALAVQSDGKILVGGAFISMTPNGATTSTTRLHLARLNTDGTLDTAFDPSASNSILAIAVQSDGKILVGGTFTTFTPPSSNTITRAYLARLATDGKVDETFHPSPNGAVLALALQADGKVIAGGTFTSFPIPNVAADAAVTTYTRNRIARLNTDGALDTAFDPNANGMVNTVAVQSDGKILLGGVFTTLTPNGTDPTKWTQRFYVARVEASGAVDTTFDLGLDERSGNNVTSLRVQADGRILLCGGFTSLRPGNTGTRVARSRLIRLNANGTLDTAFNPAAGGANPGAINAIAVQADGRIVIAGAFTDFAGTGTSNIARIHPEGAIDTSFSRATGADGAINAVAIRPDITGIVPQLPGFAWLNASATGLVSTFRVPSNLSLSGTVSVFAFESDGSLLLGGSFSNLATATGGNLIRIKPDGTLDTSFNPSPNGTVNLITVQLDGRILVGGTFTGFSPNGGELVTRNRLARLNRDGTVTKFDPNPNSNVTSLVELASGRVLVTGQFTSFTTNLVTTTTTTDSTATSTDKSSTETKTNADGSTTTTTITVSGTTKTTTVTTSSGGATTARNFIALLTTDGDVETSFDPNPNGPLSSMVVQADGRIVIGGAFTTVAPNVTTTGGSGTAGTTTTTNSDNTVTTVTVTVANNVTTTVTSTLFYRNYLARLNADGTIDRTYDPNPNATVYALALQADGKVLVGGEFTRMGNTPRFNLARINPDNGVDSAFDPNPNALVNRLAVQPDGSILFSGAFTTVQPAGAASVPRRGFARIAAGGALDLGFDPVPNGAISASAVRPDGTLVLAGEFTEFNPGGVMFVGGSFSNIGGLPAAGLAALNNDGSASSNFLPNPNGAVSALLIQPDGRLVVGGAFTQIAGTARNGLARFSANGTLDATFNPAPGAVTAVAIQPDGKLLLGVGSSVRRIESDGRSDATFSTAFATTSTVGVRGLAVQADGRVLVLVGGSILRLNANGSGESTFTDASLNATGTTIALQSDGRIFKNGVRLTTTGAADASFAPAPDASVSAVTVQTDGRVLLAGAFKSVGGLTRVGLARLAPTGTAVQSMAIAGGTGATRNLVWMRDGTSMELSSVRFEVSQDGRNWTVLTANAQRATATRGWQSGNVTVPVNAPFYVRARGLVASGTGTSGIVEYTQQFNLSDSARFVGPAATGDIANAVIDAKTGQAYFAQTSSAGNGDFVIAAAPALVDVVTMPPTAPGSVVVDGGAGTARIANLSVRSRVTADTPLITGFAISGTTPRTVLLRGVGPSLGVFGVTAPLAQPRLQLFDSAGRLLVENNGWAATPANVAAVGEAMARTGAFPFAANSGNDAAVALTLAPGAYSMQVQDRSPSTGSGQAGTGGVALAEIYDADTATTSRLVNLSSRSSVTSADGAFITGFVVSGGTRNLLVRGLGPALMQFGVKDVLPDPMVSVYDATGRLVSTNDNWTNATGALGAQVSAFPLTAGSSDAALSLSLAPGAYTVQISAAPPAGRGGPADLVLAAIGAAMLEVYELP
ncbi:MAG: hypothetical protein HZA93_03425 [Verrucomicrobia bacterium]|nr:hypothetical protein [Verrucomicrobiota bacterium]